MPGPALEGPAVLGAGAGRPLRADAERNRLLIVTAAARIFARDGLDAGFDEIAREAGVGVGTVYRRFPDREKLLLALFEDRLESMIALVERAAGQERAIDGLRVFVEGAIEHHVADRGLKELVFGQSECTERMVGARERMEPVLAGLIARARDEGQLRPGVAVSDLMMMVFMVATAGSLTADVDPQQWRRQFALAWPGLLRQDGDRLAEPAAELPARPLTVDELTAVFNQGQGRTPA